MKSETKENEAKRDAKSPALMRARRALGLAVFSLLMAGTAEAVTPQKPSGPKSTTSAHETIAPEYRVEIQDEAKNLLNKWGVKVENGLVMLHNNVGLDLNDGGNTQEVTMYGFLGEDTVVVESENSDGTVDEVEIVGGALGEVRANLSKQDIKKDNKFGAAISQEAKELLAQWRGSFDANDGTLVLNPLKSGIISCDDGTKSIAVEAKEGRLIVTVENDDGSADVMIASNNGLKKSISHVNATHR